MILPWKDKEQHLLDLFKQDKHYAMNKLYAEYADYLTGVCARYISNEESLKDVLQESFIKIFTQIHQFEYRGKDSLKAWMTKIVVNESLGQLRKEKDFHLPIHETDLADLQDEEPDTDRMDAETLFTFIRSLPPGYRTVFNLYVIEKKSHKEIAEMLNIHPGTSMSQFARARNLLAEMIRNYKLKTENR